jgi:hypothetical protein
MSGIAGTRNAAKCSLSVLAGPRSDPGPRSFLKATAAPVGSPLVRAPGWAVGSRDASGDRLSSLSRMVGIAMTYDNFW